MEGIALGEAFFNPVSATKPKEIASVLTTTRQEFLEAWASNRFNYYIVTVDLIRMKDEGMPESMIYQLDCKQFLPAGVISIEIGVRGIWEFRKS